MKKYFAALLVAAAAAGTFSLAACGESGTPSGVRDEGKTTVTYTFVNGDDSFSFEKVQDTGSGLDYDYTAVETSGVWYSSQDLQTPVSVADGKEMTVYTDFTDITVTFIYKSQGKTVAELVEYAVTARNGYTLAAEQTLEGHAFGGWKKGDDVFAAGSEFDFTGIKSGSIVTLDAVWHANEFEVTYINGSDRQTVKQDYGSAVKAAPEKTGYTFVGWMNESGEKVETLEGAVTLTAKYEPFKYETSFELDGYDGKFAYENGEFDYGEVIALPTLSKAGYTFAGWSLSVDGGDYAAAGDSYTVGATLSAKSLAFKAVFNANPHTVTVVGKDASGAAMNKTVTLYTGDNIYEALDDLATDDFSGWYKEEGLQNLIAGNEKVTADTAESFSVYGEYAPRTYTASFDVNGTVTTQELSFRAQLAEPEKPEGYNFTGWYNADGVKFEKMPAYSVSLQAKFEIQQFVVSYTDEHLSETPDSATVDYNTEITVAAPLGTVANCEFIGWRVGDTTYAAGDKIAVKADMEFVALWDGYTVSVRLVDWDGYEIFASEVEAGWKITLAADSVWLKVPEFAGFYSVDIFGDKTYYELGDSIDFNAELHAYYVNNSSNPATSGKEITFTPASYLFMYKEGTKYSVAAKRFEKKSGSSAVTMEKEFVASSLPKDLYLPAVYQGLMVDAIADGSSMSAGAFSPYTDENRDAYVVTGTVYIPSNYIRVGNYAFYSQQATTLEFGRDSKCISFGYYSSICMNTSAIYAFPENLRTVQDYAMSTGRADANHPEVFGLYDDDGARITKFPASITWVGQSAFANCDVFEELDLTNLGKGYRGYKIRSRTFTGLTLVKRLVIGKYVTAIGEGAFIDLDSLESVTIPASITSIGDSAFKFCDKLTDVSYEMTGSKLTEIGRLAFFMVPLKSAILPDSVKTIGMGAFSWTVESAVPGWSVNDAERTNITEIKLPAELTFIDDYAFTGANIDSIVFPNKLQVIGAASFMNTDIKKIDLPDSVVQICDYAFAKLFNYKNTVTEDDNFVLHFGKNLTKLGGTNKKDSTATHGMIFRCMTNITGIEFDPECALTEIGTNTFSEMRGLKGEVHFPSKLVKLYASQFEYVNSKYEPYDATEAADITAVTLPATLEYLGGYAFSNCRQLASVTIEENYAEGAHLTIGNGAFKNCEKLTRFVVPCQTTYISGGTAVNTKNGPFWNCSSLARVEFKSRTQGGDTTLTDATLEMTSVAFTGCTSLSRIIVRRNTMITIYFPRAGEESGGWLYNHESEADNCFLEDCTSVKINVPQELLVAYNQPKNIWKKANSTIIKL